MFLNGSPLQKRCKVCRQASICKEWKTLKDLMRIEAATCHEQETMVFLYILFVQFKSICHAFRLLLSLSD